jgi:putative ABC transport system permease protein
LHAEQLGFGRGTNAIGKSFYSVADALHAQPVEYRIIGLVPDQYFFGVHTKIKPMALQIRPDAYNVVSIRVNGQNLSQNLNQIDKVWTDIIQDYPVDRQSLDDVFNFFYRLLKGINNVLAAFAGIALFLALFGLFGLTAYMAQHRTKEIGLRKVMGASVQQIVGLLIWQFSKPVLWSMLIAMPLAYAVSGIYLDFFFESINLVFPVIFLASVIAMLAAWLIVAIHAISIARASPIRALRYE